MLKIIKIKPLTQIAYWTGVQSLKCKLSGLAANIELNHKPKNQHYSKQQILGILYHELSQDKTEGVLVLDNYDGIKERLSYFSVKYSKKFNFAEYPPLASWDEVKKMYSTFFESLGKKNSTAQSYPEKTLASQDGILTGQPDLLIKDELQISIIEYKSGSIYDADRNLKVEYVNQLHYYSFLVNENFPTTTTKLYLKSMKDGNIEIQNSKANGQNLATQFKESLAETNRVLSSEKSIETIVEILAEPGVESCQFCNIKGFCSKFKQVSDKMPEAQSVVGKIKSLKVENKHFYGLLEIDSGSEIITVRNVPRAHLHILKYDDLVTISNAKKTNDQNYEFTIFSKVNSYE